MPHFATAGVSDVTNNAVTVTGANSRIGLTRPSAAHDGFTVDHVRHPELSTAATYSRIEIRQLVPANLSSRRAFVTGRHGRADLLVHNASVSGGVDVPRLPRPTSRHTSEGAT